jgi:hypothetical protein
MPCFALLGLVFHRYMGETIVPFLYLTAIEIDRSESDPMSFH